MTPSYDVVIAGGGPAGSTLATLLSRKGRSVALCDAARFPRHKICGEYLPPSALSTFADLGAQDAILALARPHVGMAVISPDGTKVLGRYGDGSSGWSIRRYDLDRLLLERARASGAMVREGARVAAIDRLASGCIEVTTHGDGAAPLALRARVLVGADGRNSFVARRFGLRRAEPRHRKWAVMAHFAGEAFTGDHGEMIVTPYGYCGINPLPLGLANVCVVVERADLRRARGGDDRLAGYLLRILRSHPLTRARLEGAVIAAGPWATGPMACRSTRSIGDSILLVGDAAGFYDPFTGEGIGMALRGASMAAEVLDEALAKGDTTARALLPYETGRRRAFRDRLRLDRRLQVILKSPWLTDRVARRLRRNPPLADLLARVAGDTTEAARVLGLPFLARLILS